MKKYLFIATALVALASCTSDDFVGENNPAEESANGAIAFGFDLQNITRGEIAGNAAATLLGNNFYVTGTKGTEGENNPTETLVFDNYLVHYGVNTAGTTTSNTANWEYVGIDQGATPNKLPEDYERVKLSSIQGEQTIKFWDYGVEQYDFLAFSTGTYKAVSGTPSTGEIGVTVMKYGAGLASEAVAYTFTLSDVNALKNAFITDITKVPKTSFGKEVTLKFKNLGSKVRIALYETVPGYSVKNVKFYSTEGTDTPTDLGTNTGENAILISPSTAIPTAGSIDVKFPHVGVNHSPEATSPNTPKADYNKASVTVTASGTNAGNLSFDALTAQLVASERNEVKSKDGGGFEAETGNVFLGRNLPTATFAGSSAAKFYQTVFPVSTSAPLVLRVDYTLVPIDGASETITVKGAKAVVPSTYTVWQPNYAYTYVFKITDNTNGWTGTTSESSGLFPITFDAVVAEATDANAEQTTITTVATPTITTYQQNHNPNKNGDWLTTDEYSKGTGKDIYVQVMDNSLAPAVLVGATGSSKPKLNSASPYTASLLYAIDAEHASTATEALVMDALQNRTSELATDDVTGRNGLSLTKNDNINASVVSIVNGVDDNPITVGAGDAAQIAITASGFAKGTYAYVYDYSATTKTTVTEFQPIVPGTTYVVDASSTKTFATITTTYLETLTPEASSVDLTAAGAMNYIYFSKTTNGTGTTTYSYISVTGKTSLPAGVVKVSKTDTNIGTANGDDTPAEGTFYFDKYINNNGSYAVKVIKIVD